MQAGALFRFGGREALAFGSLRPGDNGGFPGGPAPGARVMHFPGPGGSLALLSVRSSGGRPRVVAMLVGAVDRRQTTRMRWLGWGRSSS
jgi:hypothetical protein